MRADREPQSSRVSMCWPRPRQPGLSVAGLQIAVGQLSSDRGPRVTAKRGPQAARVTADRRPRPGSGDREPRTAVGAVLDRG